MGKKNRRHWRRRGKQIGGEQEVEVGEYGEEESKALGKKNEAHGGEQVVEVDEVGEEERKALLKQEVTNGVQQAIEVGVLGEEESKLRMKKEAEGGEQAGEVGGFGEKGVAVGMGAKLGIQLLSAVKDDKARLWKVLFDFWVEMILFLAPSDNLQAHSESLANGGEFITHLWALLTHVGGRRTGPAANDENQDSAKGDQEETQQQQEEVPAPSQPDDDQKTGEE